MKRKRMVIALGGNAIKLPHQKGSSEEQAANLRVACGHILRLIYQGYEVVLTHGNGPQVGNLLIQQEAAAALVPAQPMDIVSAMTQGQLGYLLQQVLMNQLRACNVQANVVTLITRVLVDRDDPALDHPSKPVGPFYSLEAKERYEKEKGYRIARVLPAGEKPYRRVVPSPDPIRIVEGPALKKLVDAGMTVIAAGGGGVPVVRNDRGELEGVEGVVDKDLAAEKLAEAVAADLLLILTDIRKVKLGFGSPQERDLERMTAAEAKGYLENGEFLAGSMAPKVLACIRFLEYGGEEAIITSLDKAFEAVEHREGTLITA